MQTVTKIQSCFALSLNEVAPRLADGEVEKHG
jgi:hypothetical protein